MDRKVKLVRGAGPSAVLLIEEAVHLLRQAPLSTWAIYATGACPWVLGFAAFWAHTTWFAPSPSTLAWSSLGLVFLFVLLKTSQTEFCARLLAQRLGAPAPAKNAMQLVRVAAAQTKHQSWGIWAVPFSLVLSLPFGWTFSYFQTLTVLGIDGRKSRISREALDEAQRWPGQNHLGLLYLSVIALCAWVNLAAAFYSLPWLANRLLGIENVFSLGGWGWINTTFLTSVSAITWLAMDPLIKAFYVLRVFYGRAQRTGEDLRVDLLASSRRSRGRIAATVLVLVVLSVVSRPIRADATPPARTQAVASPSLDRALDRVLERRDFQWRMRPRPSQAPASAKNEGAFVRFLRRGMEFTKDTARGIAETVGRFVRWVRGLFMRSDANPDGPKKSGVSASVLQLFLYALIGLAVVLIVGVIVVLWPKRGRAGLELLSAQPVASAKPDLEDENVQAAHLPSDGWLALAREQMTKGEWRLAFRALYLASLAQLAADGLVILGKSKTNLDYERELCRRAPSNQQLIERFTGRRQQFESVWYGRGAAGEQAVRAWFHELSGGQST